MKKRKRRGQRGRERDREIKNFNKIDHQRKISIIFFS